MTITLQLFLLVSAALFCIGLLAALSRRHAIFILIGDQFETLNTMQAFAQSVHCVVNPSEMQLIGQLVQKTSADNDTFLAPYREAQHRLYTKVK